MKPARPMKDIPAALLQIPDNLADYILKTSVDRMAADASGLVKRYPIAAIAAELALGLITLLASSQAKFSGWGNSAPLKAEKANPNCD